MNLSDFKKTILGEILVFNLPSRDKESLIRSNFILVLVGIFLITRFFIKKA